MARLATSADDVAAAQRLRHRVFMEEGQASAASNGLDTDSFDKACDHLLVLRRREGEDAGDFPLDDGELVGTYRLIRPPRAALAQAFYSSGEYDLAPLLARKQNLQFLELGRSCVRADMRAEPVAELLWQGIWNYVRAHHIDVMMGCASFDGTDPEAHATGLSYLAHHARAPEDWRVAALPERYVEMRRQDISRIDGRAALRALPPLIKGYVKLGCHVGEGAVIDHAFNTTDVLILLPVAAINPRYFAHFGAPAA
ncbi:MAG: GNAT family N-acyltransferase [Hyphomicrobiales bacterium]